MSFHGLDGVCTMVRISFYLDLTPIFAQCIHWHDTGAFFLYTTKFQAEVLKNSTAICFSDNIPIRKEYSSQHSCGLYKVIFSDWQWFHGDMFPHSLFGQIPKTIGIMFQMSTKWKFEVLEFSSLPNLELHKRTTKNRYLKILNSRLLIWHADICHSCCKSSISIQIIPNLWFRWIK